LIVQEEEGGDAPPPAAAAASGHADESSETVAKVCLLVHACGIGLAAFGRILRLVVMHRREKLNSVHHAFMLS